MTDSTDKPAGDQAPATACNNRQARYRAQARTLLEREQALSIDQMMAFCADVRAKLRGKAPGHAK